MWRSVVVAVGAMVAVPTAAYDIFKEGGEPMKYARIIASEAASLPLGKQAEVIKFIKFLKAKQCRKEVISAPVSAFMSLAEIKAFFGRFKVDTSNFKFHRDEANAR